MRIVFMGATDLGCECLNAILELKQDVVGVMTIPRRFNISWSQTPVENNRFKNFEELTKPLGVPLHVVTPPISNPGHLSFLQDLSPDLLVVVGWYYLVPRSWRDVAPLGAVGIHTSLLPRYRGGAPLVWALIQGETTAGVTLFHLSDNVDDGDIVAQTPFNISETDDIAQVIGKANALSVEMVRKFIPLLEQGKAPRAPQDPRHATVMPQRRPEDGRINWSRMSAKQVYNWIRAQSHPYPGAFTLLDGQKIIFRKASLTVQTTGSARKPGTLEILDGSALDGFGVWCADHQMIAVLQVEPAGESLVSGKSFLSNHEVLDGAIFESPEKMTDSLGGT